MTFPLEATYGDVCIANCSHLAFSYLLRLGYYNASLSLDWNVSRPKIYKT